MSFMDRFFSRSPADASHNRSAGPTTDVMSWRGDGAQSPELRVEAGLASDRGCVREINEDFARIIRPTTSDELARRGLLAALGQPLQTELADRLQHPEPRLAVHLRLLPQQALVDEGTEQDEGGQGDRGTGGQRVSSFQSP